MQVLFGCDELPNPIKWRTLTSSSSSWFQREQRLTHSLERGVLVEILDRLLLLVGAGDLTHGRVRLSDQRRRLDNVVHLAAI